MATKETLSSLELPQTTVPAPGLPGRLKRAVFGISAQETSFEKRRFRGKAEAVRARLEEVGLCFARGYHIALEEDRPLPLAARLEEVDPELRGFAYEGAAMGLALLDTVTPWRRDRFQRFMAGPGDAHAYISYVGAGWVMARLPVRVERYVARFPPMMRWLALDGYGFHEGYFHWPRSVGRQKVPARLHGYARRGFDQGLGRSFWFVDGADVRLLPKTIGAFPVERQGDLWSGLGLACGYAGGRTRAELEELRRAAGPFAPQLAQGVAFAAKARQRAGNPSPYTALAAEVVCGVSADEAAAVTDAVGPEAPAGEPVAVAEPAFEVWRRRIQEHFSRRSST